MHKFKTTVSLAALATAASLAGYQQAFAATAAAADNGGTEVTEVIVTGTRQIGVKAADSAAPIQLIGAAALKRVGQQDLMQALTQSVPSFNAEGYGADTAALTLSAQLRGLNPNDTLVLVDGKRRHNTANLHVDTGPFAGAAAADLSFLPVNAIDHVEILTDGAAAQYGSDAIAGVINIILKKNNSGGNISGTLGQYEEGDGKSFAWTANKGFKIGDNGFFNVTLEQKFHGFSFQGTYDARLFNPDGSLKSTDSPVDAAGVVGAAHYPFVNRIYGDPTYDLYNAAYNFGYDVGNGVEAYSYGTVGRRIAQGYENYRVPSKVSQTVCMENGEDGESCNTTYPFPNGFEPREKSREWDYAFTSGFKGKLLSWDWDLSTTYGKDIIDVYTVNSANKSLYADTGATPINFYDGNFTSEQWTTNLDISRDFNVGMASPLSTALGGEIREDGFRIGQGDPGSIYKEGGQSYPGFQPSDAASHHRVNVAAYVDFAVNPVKNLHTDVAGRYEHYNDFGNAWSGKVTARYDFSPMFALRGTVSSGFRAPTLEEEYYSATNVAPGFAFVQLPPNSPAALLAGFKPLQPEKSVGYSIGFTAHPAPKMQITADFYDIEIHNRILQSASLVGLSGTSVISQGVLNAIHAHGNVLDPSVTYVGIQIYNNAGNTRTQGVEVTANYASDFGEYGHVDWTAGFNYNKNTITKLNALPAAVANPDFGQTSLLQPTNLSTFTSGTPKTKLILGAYWTKGKWGVSLKETIYGPSSEILSPNGAGTGVNARNAVVGTAGITDLNVSYEIRKGLKLEGGANNIFNKRPPVIPLVPNGSGGVKPADGNNVYNEPLQFSPYGINGGYYYGKVTFSF